MSSKRNDTRTRILEATWHLMEQHRGVGISMAVIARKAGISRQALYLHFASRVALVTETVKYVDEVKGLSERLKLFETAQTGEELLEACIEVWGNYIPEIYGIARALLSSLDTDEAASTAWNGCMDTLRQVCTKAVATLHKEGRLSGGWKPSQASDLLWTLLSIQNWEQLTIVCGWSNKKYVEWMKKIAKRSFVTET